MDEQLQKALTRSLKLLSYRPRTEQEIKNYLHKKGVDQVIIEKTIQLLNQDKLLNDKEFAKWWIEQRQQFRPKGKIILKQEMLAKGVGKETVEQALSEIKSEYEIAKGLFLKKKKQFDRYAGDKYKQKVIGFFQRRGFEWDIIRKLLKNEL